MKTEKTNARGKDKVKIKEIESQEEKVGSHYLTSVKSELENSAGDNGTSDKGVTTNFDVRKDFATSEGPASPGTKVGAGDSVAAESDDSNSFNSIDLDGEKSPDIDIKGRDTKEEGVKRAST